VRDCLPTALSAFETLEKEACEETVVAVNSAGVILTDMKVK